MAKAKQIKDENEGYVAPLLPPEIIGHQSQQQRLIDSFRSGKAPHAWLMTGNKGIGKRTVAQLMAAFVLDLPNSPNRLVNDVMNSHMRLIENGSHPDCSLLQVATDPKTGKQKTEISVEQVRNLKEGMYKTPSMASSRVAIIDSLDEMNRNSANAILKLLEEPPANAFLFLVCHNPGRLLPTIRSRCAQLSFNSLSELEMQQWVQQAQTHTDFPANFNLALKAANGRPGLAMDMLQNDLLPIEEELQAYLGSKNSSVSPQAIAAKIAKTNRDAKALLKCRLFDWMHEAARTAAIQTSTEDAALVDWQKLWETTDQRFKQAEALNLDERGLWTSVLLGLRQN
ncbi:MAG: hypothetical protein ACPGVN_01225 [Alphaproteobacteria bacterium]